MFHVYYLKKQNRNITMCEFDLRTPNVSFFHILQCLVVANDLYYNVLLQISLFTISYIYIAISDLCELYLNILRELEVCPSLVKCKNLL